MTWNIGIVIFVFNNTLWQYWKKVLDQGKIFLFAGSVCWIKVFGINLLDLNLKIKPSILNALLQIIFKVIDKC